MISIEWRPMAMAASIRPGERGRRGRKALREKRQLRRDEGGRRIEIGRKEGGRDKGGRGQPERERGEEANNSVDGQRTRQMQIDAGEKRGNDGDVS